MTQKPALKGNVPLITSAILLPLGFWLMGRAEIFCSLRPHSLARVRHTHPGYVGVLAFNVFPTAFVLIRKFLLKDTGRKLTHLGFSRRIKGSSTT